MVVLLVDDEVEFVTTLAERLRLRELRVDSVFDGTQALAYIGRIEPDVSSSRTPGTTSASPSTIS